MGLVGIKLFMKEISTHFSGKLILAARVMKMGIRKINQGKLGNHLPWIKWLLGPCNRDLLKVYIIINGRP